MATLEPEQAYRAVVAFLDEHWKQRPVPGDFGDFWGYCSYIPGVGTADPAMWYDWLAVVKTLQTGLPVSDAESATLTPAVLKPLDPEQGYLALFQFIKEYWERVSRPAEIGDLLGRMRYTPGAGTADPEMWTRWLAAIDKVQVNR
jgi:hypothetical protein